MAIRKVMRMGHPVLRRRAEPVSGNELGSERIRRLVDDMVDTLHDYGGIGLAAPQVGESLRLAIIEIEHGGNARYGELPEMPLTVFANPEIEVLDPTPQGFWEGCLSVPGLRGWVERPRAVRVRWLDLTGAEHTARFEGFPATVFQHEFDHLDGHLYVDRMTDMTRLAFEEELVKHGTPDA